MSRSTGLDAQTLQELKRVLKTKKQRMEEGAGEEALWKVDGEMHRILKSDEQLVNDRNSVLLTPTADYHIALSMVEAAQKRAKEATAKAGGGGSGGAGRKSQFDQRQGASGSSTSSMSPASSSRLHPPIIIVPSDPSAMVNMTNIVDFLENAHFVSPSFLPNLFLPMRAAIPPPSFPCLTFFSPLPCLLPSLSFPRSGPKSAANPRTL